MIIIACLGIVFSASINTDAITDQVDIITNSSYPDPNDAKYDTFFGNDPFGYLMDLIFFIVAKIVATIALVVTIIVPISIFTQIPILAFPYASLYLLLGIGLFKLITGVIGR